MSIRDQLVAAIQAGDLVNLRALLLSNEDNGYGPPGRNIDAALFKAAQVGGVECCRILWEAHSPQGKQKYLASGCSSYSYVYDYLHMAASCGQWEIVRLFVEEFKWNINVEDGFGNTPLYSAIGNNSIEMSRYLLENGANANGGTMEIESPLWYAVKPGSADIVRLLLEYGADPNRTHIPADEEADRSRRQYPRHTDNAIEYGDDEMLSMLLQHGAHVDSRYRDGRATSLNMLFKDSSKSRATKLSICRILVQHAKEDHGTRELMQVSFEFAIHQCQESCQILLEAGIAASAEILHRAFHFAIRVENLSICQLLVREYQVDPFLQEEGDDDSAGRDEESIGSPFQAAARLADTSILEYLLGVWDERFAASTGGKNSHGDYPIHLACCDPMVSFQAIQLLINRHPDALTMMDGEEGVLPFHFAANWGASLDVLFYLLQRCPDALGHVGNGTANVGQRQTLDGDHTNGSSLESTGNRDQLQVCGPAPKKSKTTH